MRRSATARAVITALTAKGMVPYENDHHMFKKTIGGVTTLITSTSHDDREIRGALATLMARQCCLKVSEFWNLVDCSLSQQQWDERVQKYVTEAGGRNPFLGR